MTTQKNILITGAGGGFGRLITTALLDAGHQVAASMREINGRNAQAATELKALGAYTVEIDITRDQSVIDGVSQVSMNLGSIDILINNAGIGALGLQEGYTPDDWKRVFEVNVFGVQRMIRATLPYMKQQHNGLLILISSLTGRLAIPFQGPYGPSKWAAEALAESYRLEVAQFGIESCIIEPGGFPTQFMDGLVQPGEPERLSDYGQIKDMPAAFLNSFEQVFAANPQQDAQSVADAVKSLIDRPHGARPIRTIVDFMGLGDKVKPSNELLERTNAQVYEDFGIGHLTKISK